MTRGRRFLDAIALALIVEGAPSCDRPAVPPSDGSTGDDGTESAESADSAGHGVFRDVTREAGIDFVLANGASPEKRVIETMVGGVAWIDFDRDGFLDLYVPNGHSASREAWEEGAESDRLWRNRGDGTFEDVTERAGISERRFSNGAAVADFDNDGDSDILVTNVGRNTLWRNRGDGSFEDHTVAAGLNARGNSASAAWLDHDRDGDLDLFVARYLRYHPRHARPCRERGENVYCHPRFFDGEPDLFYENRGDGTFVDVSAVAGIDRGGPGRGKGLGVVAFDYDGDGRTDIYVANDTTPNFLWHNRGDGTFEDRAFAAGVALGEDGKAQAGMGVDFGDVDGDGDFDLWVTNFANETNNLFLSDGRGNFVDAVQRSRLGLTFSRLGFGTVLADFDLDGDLDIAVLNGHVDDLVERDRPGSGIAYRQRPDLFLNRGDGVFDDGDRTAGSAFDRPVVGRGLASADFDNDGDLDLALAVIGGPLILLRNESRRHDSRGPHWLCVTLRGTSSPRDGYGARVEARIGERTAVFECQSARSYLSAVDPRILIGLGPAVRVDRLTVRWTSGRVSTLTDVDADRRIEITEPP